MDYLQHGVVEPNRKAAVRQKLLGTEPGEHTAKSATAWVELSKDEMPSLIVQSGRAGARISYDECYVSVNECFLQTLSPTLRILDRITLSQLWDASSYQSQIKAAFLLCQTEGPQMVRGCRLQNDLLNRSFDLLFCAEPATGSVLQILFENVPAVLSEEQTEELRRLRAIVDLAPVLISIKDRLGVVRLANRMFGVLQGPEPEEYLNRSVFEIFPKDIADELWKNDLTTFRMGTVVEVEETVRHRDGTLHTYLTYKYPLRQANGEIGEVCAISSDITARKYYELKAIEAMRKAEEASRVKSDFLAHMSHEIRTPLTVIRGYIDLIARKSGAESESIREWISSVVRASKQLELIINDILDLSKVEAGIIEVEKKPINLTQFMLELENNFALKAQEKKLDFQIRLEGEVPEFIATDSLRFRQVLDNLVSNALKFTEQGSVEILVKHPPAGTDQLLQVLVRDTGIGLSEEEQKRLFQPFIQADGSITRKYGGTGLGLVLAKRLAQLLGGDVQIYRSAPGQGTEMLAMIDMGNCENATMISDLKSSALVASTAHHSGGYSESLQGKDLLLVEDAEDIREFLRYFLVQSGARVDAASYGEEALAILEVRSFDLVLMDLQMPMLDGMQTMQAMRARGYRGAIVALTAHALQGERERCIEAGFDEFLTKPIQWPEVLKVLEKLLGNAGETQPPAY